MIRRSSIIDVRQELHGLSTRQSKIVYRLAAWFLGCLEASSVAYPTPFLLVESVGDPIFIFLASFTVGHCLHIFCDNVLIQFLKPWFVKTLTLREVSTALSDGC